ncbi:hypothetical protein A4X13_0g7293 [Tilletia indica]|uniref:Uncharacterized protein n=1 Tax=Tilletia indica TaxID=43049 RepID=A0A8T8SKH0_9BASI|nr:hypothetical protein A4X13_0g7293 [Tilletia indica]
MNCGKDSNDDLYHNNSCLLHTASNQLTHPGARSSRIGWGHIFGRTLLAGSQGCTITQARTTFTTHYTRCFIHSTSTSTGGRRHQMTMADSPASAVSDAASFHTAASASSPRSHHPRIPLPPVLHLDPQSQTREQEEAQPQQQQQQQRPRKRSKQRPQQSNDASTSTLPSTSALPSTAALSNRRSSTASMTSNTSSTSASIDAVVRAKPSKTASAAAAALRRPSADSITSASSSTAPDASVTKSRPSKTSLRMSSAAAVGMEAPGLPAAGGGGGKKKKGAKRNEEGQSRAKGGESAAAATGGRRGSTVATQPQPPASGSRQRKDDLLLEDAHTHPRRPLSKKNSVPGLAAGFEGSAGIVPGPSASTKRGKESNAGSRRAEGAAGAGAGAGGKRSAGPPPSSSASSSSTGSSPSLASTSDFSRTGKNSMGMGMGLPPKPNVPLPPRPIHASAPAPLAGSPSSSSTPTIYPSSPRPAGSRAVKTPPSAPSGSILVRRSRRKGGDGDSEDEYEDQEGDQNTVEGERDEGAPSFFLNATPTISRFQSHDDSGMAVDLTTPTQGTYPSRRTTTAGDETMEMSSSEGGERGPSAAALLSARALQSSLIAGGGSGSTQQPLSGGVFLGSPRRSNGIVGAHAVGGGSVVGPRLGHQARGRQRQQQQQQPQQHSDSSQQTQAMLEAQIQLQMQIRAHLMVHAQAHAQALGLMRGRMMGGDSSQQHQYSAEGQGQGYHQLSGYEGSDAEDLSGLVWDAEGEKVGSSFSGDRTPSASASASSKGSPTPAAAVSVAHALSRLNLVVGELGAEESVSESASGLTKSSARTTRSTSMSTSVEEEGSDLSGVSTPSGEGCGHPPPMAKIEDDGKEKGERTSSMLSAASTPNLGSKPTLDPSAASFEPSTFSLPKKTSTGNPLSLSICTSLPVPPSEADAAAIGKAASPRALAFNQAILDEVKGMEVAAAAAAGDTTTTTTCSSLSEGGAGGGSYTARVGSGVLEVDSPTQLRNLGGLLDDSLAPSGRGARSVVGSSLRRGSTGMYDTVRGRRATTPAVAEGGEPAVRKASLLGGGGPAVPGSLPSMVGMQTMMGSAPMMMLGSARSHLSHEMDGLASTWARADAGAGAGAGAGGMDHVAEWLHRSGARTPHGGGGGLDGSAADDGPTPTDSTDPRAVLVGDLSSSSSSSSQGARRKMTGGSTGSGNRGGGHRSSGNERELTSSSYGRPSATRAPTVRSFSNASERGMAGFRMGSGMGMTPLAAAGSADISGGAHGWPSTMKRDTEEHRRRASSSAAAAAAVAVAQQAQATRQIIFQLRQQQAHLQMQQQHLQQQAQMQMALQQFQHQQGLRVVSAPQGSGSMMGSAEQSVLARDHEADMSRSASMESDSSMSANGLAAGRPSSSGSAVAVSGLQSLRRASGAAVPPAYGATTVISSSATAASAPALAGSSGASAPSSLSSSSSSSATSFLVRSPDQIPVSLSRPMMLGTGSASSAAAASMALQSAVDVGQRDRSSLQFRNGSTPAAALDIGAGSMRIGKPDNERLLHMAAAASPQRRGKGSIPSVAAAALVASTSGGGVSASHNFAVVPRGGVRINQSPSDSVFGHQHRNRRTSFGISGNALPHSRSQAQMSPSTPKSTSMSSAGDSGDVSIASSAKSKSSPLEAIEESLMLARSAAPVTAAAFSAAMPPLALRGSLASSSPHSSSSLGKPSPPSGEHTRAQSPTTGAAAAITMAA